MSIYSTFMGNTKTNKKKINKNKLKKKQNITKKKTRV